MKTFCVYCSSSAAVASVYFEAASELGTAIGERTGRLVYGGCSIGLMGAVADAVRAAGGEVTGIVPQSFADRGLSDMCAHELIVTRDLRERKAEMELRADAFLVLPGGFGTLEELFEILTLKQLQLHGKPVVLLNVNGFFDPLTDLFEHIYRANFANPAYRQFYHMAGNVTGAFEYLDAYEAPAFVSKWG